MKLLLLSAFFILPFAQADENVLPLKKVRALGYKPVKQTRRESSRPLKQTKIKQHSLKWPVAFRDPKNPIGNSMIQFQDYGAPYYHGGCDIVSTAGEWLVAPVDGILEGGHYSYTRNPDGSKTKHWIPWPGSGDKNYFEIAVINNEGLRFEFHHVDRDNLPVEIKNALDKGGVRVHAGDRLGRVVRWPVEGYDHIHYNIVRQDLLFFNPEYFSEKLEDKVAPEIHGVYAIDQAGKIHEVRSGALPFKPVELVVATTDQNGQGAKFQHPPVVTEVEFANGVKAGWDFSKLMAGADGKWPPLWDYYRPQLRTPSGRILRTFGDYGSGFNLIRLKVPAGAEGSFKVRVADSAGLTKVVGGQIRRGRVSQ